MNILFREKDSTLEKKISLPFLLLSFVAIFSILSFSAKFVASQSLPIAPVITATPSKTQITIDWVTPTQNTGGVTFSVYKDTTKFDVSAGTRSYIFTDLTEGTKYSFQVIACDASSRCESSNTISASLLADGDTTPPSIPTNLSVKEVSPIQINLEWGPSTDNVKVKEYQLYKDEELLLSQAGISASITKGIIPGGTYQFKVRAVDTSGNLSEFSNIAYSTTPSDTEAPTAPSAVTALYVTANEIHLNWKASSDNIEIAKYEIYKGTTKVGIATPQATNFLVKNLLPDTAYSFTVKAFDFAGNVGTSDVFNVKTKSEKDAVKEKVPKEETILTDDSVLFSVYVGANVCKDGENYAPVTFIVNPVIGGYFTVSGANVASKKIESGTTELKGGKYTWSGFVNTNYIISGTSRGTFSVPSTCDLSVKNSTEEIPVKTFSTYFETETALQKDAETEIPKNVSVDQKLELISAIRSEYALAPQSETVSIGGTSFSRAYSPEKIVQKVEQIIEERAPEASLVDSDGDGISDYDEINIYGTDPNKKDTDGDGLTDGQEILAGSNPLKKNIAPVAYENPKTNTVSASVTPSTFSVNKTTAIFAPKKGKEPAKMTGIQFEGKGMANGFVTLYFFSNPIVVTVKTGSDGRWSYTVDKELENGKHEVYVAMTESNGKIIAKSSPIPFVKTAQSATLGSVTPVIGDAGANNSQQGFFGGNSLIASILAMVFVIVAGLIASSIILKKKVSANEAPTGISTDNQKNV